MKKLPSARVLRRLLEYNPDTGLLFWKPRPAWMFKTKTAAKIWNTKYANKQAFTAVRPTGYPFGNVLRCPVDAHRVIWCMRTGEWPTQQIDHIKGLSDGNRWRNLRHVSRQENARNKRMPSNNKSGQMGVVWDRNRQKWMAMIKVNQRNIYLGRFDQKTDAIAARKAAERRYGFSKYHGRSA
ncbi:MAG: HNH endonuclease signature motif containing protein [Pseudomonadota bacterium]